MIKLLFVILVTFQGLFAFEELNDNNFYEKIENKKVIIDFHALWCPPCKVVSKHLKELKKSDLKDVIIYKVDIDKNENLKAAYGIVSLPTIAYIKNTVVLKKIVGIRSTSDLKNKIKEYFH